MAKEQPKLARQFGFQDDPQKADSDMLKLGMETVPVWIPGHSMRALKRENLKHGEAGETWVTIISGEAVAAQRTAPVSE